MANVAGANAAPRPFLKWLGGKSQLLPELSKHIPERFGRYHEPFLGGGALFFHLAAAGRITRATLSDQNAGLVATYKTVRDDVESLIRALRSYSRLYDTTQARRKTIYYAVRGRTIAADQHIAAAARLIFLNRTCYNGAYRVNKRGEFNVPIGRYANPTICDAENLRACSRILAQTTLQAADFGLTSMDAHRGDFWYADPPYVPRNASSDFTAYTKESFGPAEQERLADIARRLKKKGVHVLLSNSDTPFVRKLYKDFAIRRVQARRAVNSRADRRGTVAELLIE
jgi:DNA adenine methylase